MSKPSVLPHTACDRRDRAELVEQFGRADIAGMENEVDGRKTPHALPDGGRPWVSEIIPRRKRQRAGRESRSER
jgi:hypothetical protein